MMQVDVVNWKLVKPCIPTPQNLKNYKLSFTDEFSAPMTRFGVLLFYPSKQNAAGNGIINLLEDSLAKVLVQLYPLAGRFRMKDSCVDCSDQGAEFVIAQAPHLELSTLIAETNLGNLDAFFQRDNLQQGEANYHMLSIQITHLKCGGLVIAICVSHKIFDAASLGTFVAAWSNACNPRPNMDVINPVFDSASLLPTKNRNNNPDTVMRETCPIVIKRFTFSKEAIARLRSKLKQKEGKRGMSRVRVVSPFITKALIRVNSAKHRPCFIMQVVNIRERTIPPLPKHLCGNLLLSSSCINTTPEAEAEDMGGNQKLVDLMSEAIDKSVADCAQILSLDEDGLYKAMVEPLMNGFKASHSGEANFVWFTDWSKLRLYEVDFGLGKPVWASAATETIEKWVNGAVLMENKEGDGIEAWVILKEHDMALFEQDDQVKSVCNLPS